MRHLVKFLGDRSNHCLLIYLFSKMAAVRHLGFVKHLFVPHMKSTCLPFIVAQNLVKISAGFNVMRVGLEYAYSYHLMGVLAFGP